MADYWACPSLPTCWLQLLHSGSVGFHCQWRVYSDSFFLPMVVLSIPLTAAFALLWAKGSDWKNTRFAGLLVVIYPWRVYWVIAALITAGGVYRLLIGIATLDHTLCVIVAVVVVLLMYWANLRLANRFARAIPSRWAPDLLHNPGQATA